ncbi:hypothetical protein RND71_033487 [Anisodus tanguticus]|uniref:Uncharacterized protein n=1 Tax=Anisodus tanguticus TaxID=243964 RepID=A0AAE1R9I0_9SOLA|nr:hypothetical protein RND71_033487 [Anisodus tanguticus]
MSVSKSSARKRVSEREIPKSERKRRVSAAEDEFDAEISENYDGAKADKRESTAGRPEEETISSVTSEVKSKIDELKLKLEKDRQSFAKALSKSSKEFEFMRNSTRKLHICSLSKVLFLVCYIQKERLFMRYEQLRKKEKSMISELEQDSTKLISELEESLKKKKQDDKEFSFLRKTLGSFLDNAEVEDFPPDD